MNEPLKNPFDLLVDQVREAIREEFAAANERLPKLLYNVKEASAMLGVEESWLSAKARSGEIPSRLLGRYRHFNMADIEAIIENSKDLIPQTACDKVKASQDGGAEDGSQKEGRGE